MRDWWLVDCLALSAAAGGGRAGNRGRAAQPAWPPVGVRQPHHGSSAAVLCIAALLLLPLPPPTTHTHTPRAPALTHHNTHKRNTTPTTPGLRVDLVHSQQEPPTAAAPRCS
jgi:hypothetical protein